MAIDLKYLLPPGENGGYGSKSEWLEEIRYVSISNQLSAIMERESSGWELASSQFFSPGELFTSYVNAPITPLFQQAECILGRADAFLNEEKPQHGFPYDRLQQQFFQLANALQEMEGGCGHYGLFAGIINRADYLERHLAHLEITRNQVVEISGSIRRDIATLQAWQGHSRKALAELSSTGYAASGHATGAYMLDRLWELCLEVSPQLSPSYIGGFMQIPMKDKTQDPYSDLAFLIREMSWKKENTDEDADAGAFRRHILRALAKRGEPDYPRMVVEYKEATSPELPLIWDFVECLKQNRTPAICPLCGKAFMRTRTQRVYCSAECGSSENRGKLHKKRKTDDALTDNAVLLEAEQYLRAMRARRSYVSKSGKPRKRDLTQEAYDAWFALYKKEKDIYINIKGNETDEETVKKAGAAFLKAVCPEGYKPHHRKSR